MKHTLLGGVDFQWQKLHSQQGFSAGSTIDVTHPIYGQGDTSPALSVDQRQTQFQGGLYGQDQIDVSHLTVIAGGRVHSGHPAPVVLIELVAENRVGQVVGEIGIEIEVVIKHIGRDLRRGVCVLVMPLPLQAVPLRPAAIRRVQSAEEADEGNGVDSNLVA